MRGLDRGGRAASWQALIFSIVILAALAACGRKAASRGARETSINEPPLEAAKTEPPQRAKAAPPAPAEIWKLFSGDRAFADVRRQVEFGPRPSGSAEIEPAQAHIVSSLEAAGWSVERQEFTDSTPRGPIKFVNIIGRFAIGGARPVPATTQRAIVCSHYDTKRFSTIKFVGASDGASSTGALLELARVLALDHALAAKIELVFFDGEEAVQNFTGIDDPKPDGLFGSRHYARQLRESGRARQFKFAILWDMIGDKDLDITLPPDSPQELMREILASADSVGVRSKFGVFDRPVLDDHVPLNIFARIPSIDLIDFNYLPWHSADDTLDKLSPASLQTVGAVTLFHLKNALGK